MDAVRTREEPWNKAEEILHFLITQTLNHLNVPLEIF